MEEDKTIELAIKKNATRLADEKVYRIASLLRDIHRFKKSIIQAEKEIGRVLDEDDINEIYGSERKAYNECEEICEPICEN